jgi:phosphatidylglycerophosphate synthase
MKITKSDIFSPANAVSLIGLSLTIYGSFHIQSLSGVLILGLGRFIDIFDGKIARATHVSRLGAAVDATCDKIGIAFLVPAIWIAHIAPIWLLVYILAQNVLNVAFSLLAMARKAKPTSSQHGKYAMFLQNVSLGFYALGNTIDSRAFTVIGLVIGLASIYWAVHATYGYFKLVPENPRLAK